MLHYFNASNRQTLTTEQNISTWILHLNRETNYFQDKIFNGKPFCTVANSSQLPPFSLVLFPLLWKKGGMFKTYSMFQILF